MGGGRIPENADLLLSVPRGRAGTTSTLLLTLQWKYVYWRLIALMTYLVRARVTAAGTLFAFFLIV